MDDDSELIVISALSQWGYCPRRCALIHIEQTFEDNIYTLRGELEHQRVDELGGELRDGVRVERGLPLWSKRLGLTGRADLVEFHGSTPYPVEYKHGRKRWRPEAELQLCAQAICLEEMLGQPVPCGAIFHQGSRRRTEVKFDDSLRQRVEEAVAAVRSLLASQTLPEPVNDARCEHCSLKESCLPEVLTSGVRLRRVQQDLFRPRD
jgi:CRISPR-associated exonuclease Cas4